jgi:hypothetical protein
MTKATDTNKATDTKKAPRATTSVRVYKDLVKTLDILCEATYRNRTDAVSYLVEKYAHFEIELAQTTHLAAPTKSSEPKETKETTNDLGNLM